MRTRTLKFAIVMAAAFLCVAAGPAKKAVPAVGAGPGASAPAIDALASPRGLPVGPPGSSPNYFRLYGENCYLVFTNTGLFGGSGFVGDYGFHYNTGTYDPPERYAGLYSWTDAPSLNNYHSNVESTTTMPNWLALPASATTIAVEYRAKWDIEVNYDGVELELATLGEPTNWRNLRATNTVLGSGQAGQPDPTRYYYEGYSYGWKLETADVSAFRGQSVVLRFHFRSDTSNTEYHHGIYVDELKITADGTTQLYANGFETPPTSNWNTQVIHGDTQVDKWGVSQPLAAEVNFLSNGQFMGGAATTYVADAFAPDWKPGEGNWNTLVHYQNEVMEPSNKPHLRVEQFLYAYADFIIVDCYVKNGYSDPITALYVGVLMNIDIKHNAFERDDDDRVVYKSVYDAAMFYDDAELDEPVCGVVYLGSASLSSSVNFVNYPDYANDAANYGLMTNGQHDNDGAPSGANRWAVEVARGPYNLNQSQVCRFCFAIVGADNETDFNANADLARHLYTSLVDHTPISVEPASLGKIKAVFR